ncbi:MAG TPA: FAD-dependent oxidoreductase, partial [Thermoanaerobaculia bacterium]|nr:FAD-dependent oxidoreductase [Thermoanaerobaculia bacterium]
MSEQYDLIIIGSGPGGYVAGIRAGQLGMKVAVIEKDPFLGGTCLHRGCIPTKSLLENADVWTKIQKAKDFGITVGDVTIDFSQVQKRKQGVVDANAKGIEFLFKKNKVERITGFGKVVDRNTVDVDGKQLKTKNIMLAMGSVPKDLPHIKADGKRIINSDHILMLDKIPASMLVIGAGAVGSEFASIFSRFGTKTTIVEVMPQLLPIEDEEIAKEFTRIFKKKGIEVLTDAKVLSCEVSDSGVKSVVETKGKQQTIETELVLSATGRGPVTANCGLENIKVEMDKRGYIAVDEFMRTGEPGVYAIGDIVPTPALAHCASAEGILAVEHMAGKKPRPIN